MTRQAGCDLSRFAAPIGMSVPLLLYVALWIAGATASGPGEAVMSCGSYRSSWAASFEVYFTSRNPAVRPTLLRVLLCCTVALLQPSLEFLVALSTLRRDFVSCSEAVIVAVPIFVFSAKAGAGNPQEDYKKLQATKATRIVGLVWHV